MGLAALLGLIYNFAVLVGYGPDEPRHMNYVTLLLDEHRLPQIINGVEYRGAHPLHPPYYYVLLAPVIALFRGLPGNWEWHIARLVSLALCLGALILLRQIALVAGADRPASAARYATLVVAGVGLLPIFGMTAGTINNDAAMLFTVTWFLWLLAVKYPRDESWKAALDFRFGFRLGRRQQSDGDFMRRRGSGGVLDGRKKAFADCSRPQNVGALRDNYRRGRSLVCGWWYARNQMLYGQLNADRGGLLRPPIWVGCPPLQPGPSSCR